MFASTSQDGPYRGVTLIFAARGLLRDHDDVRRALAARFSKVLVDEFQDTDPFQTEIFWRLCGEPQVSV